MSTMTVGARTMCILSDGLVEQTPIRRQVGASALDGADEVAGSSGAARQRGIRIVDNRLLGDLPVEGRSRHLRLRASRVSVASRSEPDSLATMAFMDGW